MESVSSLSANLEEVKQAWSVKKKFERQVMGVYNSF